MDLDSAVGVVLIAEDPIVREALADKLRGAGAEVLATAEAPAAVRGLAFARPPHAVLWDLGVRPEEALDPAADLWTLDQPVVAIVPDAATAAETLALGARGVLSRQATGRELVAACRAAAAGLIVSSPSLVPESSTARRASSAAQELTPREMEVVALLAEGISNKSIATRLGISEHTAKFHVNAVLQKLGAQTRTEAVVRAARLGLVTI
ncbi:MAG: response regulator transcription factor [Myxococcaceae bacterium]|nr:response regulator transcription factor [Myxococcaceae bacterium]